VCCSENAEGVGRSKCRQQYTVCRWGPSASIPIEGRFTVRLSPVTDQVWCSGTRRRRTRRSSVSRSAIPTGTSPHSPIRSSWATEADEATGQFEQALMEVGASFVADPEPFELVQPGEGSLHHPPTHLAEPRAVGERHALRRPVHRPRHGHALNKPVRKGLSPDRRGRPGRRSGCAARSSGSPVIQTILPASMRPLLHAPPPLSNNAALNNVQLRQNPISDIQGSSCDVRDSSPTHAPAFLPMRSAQKGNRLALPCGRATSPGPPEHWALGTTVRRPGGKP
jgi:hypothetical protein